MLFVAGTFAAPLLRISITIERDGEITVDKVVPETPKEILEEIEGDERNQEIPEVERQEPEPEVQDEFAAVPEGAVLTPEEVEMMEAQPETQEGALEDDLQRLEFEENPQVESEEFPEPPEDENLAAEYL